MESLLEPFIHYIPLDDDHSNLDEMVEYCRLKDDECKRISERATLWVYDLLLAEESKREEKEVKRLIVDKAVKWYDDFYVFCLFGFRRSLASLLMYLCVLACCSFAVLGLVGGSLLVK